MDKNVFITHITDSYTAVAGRVAAMTPAEFEQPRRDDGWSARDIVAHLAAWYEVAAQRLRLIAQDQADLIAWVDDGELDAWNARFHSLDRLRSSMNVPARLAQAHADVVAALEALPDAALTSAELPVPISRWLPACTYEHDAEHLPEL